MRTEKTSTPQRKKRGSTLVKNPPCGLVHFVFFDPICPFSHCKDCTDCIANDMDAVFIACLRDSTKFGLA